MELPKEFKDKVVEALLVQRANFDGSDAAFSKQLDISNAIFSRIKNGEREKILQPAQWLQLGRQFDVSLTERKWKMARTAVFTIIEEDILFCKNGSKALICVGDVGVGKSYSARYLSKTLKNCFYVDCKQAKSKQQFIRLIARTVGVDNKGRYIDVKENLKYYLKMLPQPVIIVDDTGYLEYTAYMELLELWDATENCCGWYQIGDDSLREKLERGIHNKKVGYNAIFSRYSKKYTSIIPAGKEEKMKFYETIIKQVLTANCENKELIPTLVKKCLATDDHTSLGDLRRVESLLILHRN